MVQRLFNETESESWTGEAQEFSREISKAIKPVVEKYVNKGYSLRDIQYIIQNDAASICLSILMRKRIKDND